MRLLMILTLAGCSLAAQSQEPQYKPEEELRKKMLLNHPEFKKMQPLKKRKNDPLIVLPRQVQDPAVVHVPLKGEYVGNNGKGADIYSMQPYNMPCLVPDSNFTSNMPAVGNGKYKMEKSVLISPKP